MSENFSSLQVNDAVSHRRIFPFPGLETYIQRGIVRDTDTAREYITSQNQMESCVYRNFWQPDLHTKPQRKRLCRNFCTWKNFWKHPEFLWNRGKQPEKWVPVLQKPIEKLGLSINEKVDFQENIWMREREKQ